MKVLEFQTLSPIADLSVVTIIPVRAVLQCCSAAVMAPAVWPPSWSQPLALLQLDTADRAVIRVAGEVRLRLSLRGTHV